MYFLVLLTSLHLFALNFLCNYYVCVFEKLLYCFAVSKYSATNPGSRSWNIKLWEDFISRYYHYHFLVIISFINSMAIFQMLAKLHSESQQTDSVTIWRSHWLQTPLRALSLCTVIYGICILTNMLSFRQ